MGIKLLYRLLNGFVLLCGARFNGGGRSLGRCGAQERSRRQNGEQREGVKPGHRRDLRPPETFMLEVYFILILQFYTRFACNLYTYTLPVSRVTMLG